MEAEAIQAGADLQSIIAAFTQVLMVTIMGAAAAFLKQWVNRQNSDSKERSTRQVIEDSFAHAVREQYPKARASKPKEGKIPDGMRKDLKSAAITAARHFAARQGVNLDDALGAHRLGGMVENAVNNEKIAGSVNKGGSI